jgi:hypothetical protein
MKVIGTVELTLQHKNEPRMKKHTPPTITTRPSAGGGTETEENHPSYGMVRLSRYTCNPAQNFFGSAIKHHAGVSLSISKARKHRNLSKDWYFARENLIEICLTPSQLADLMTNMNMGDGVPCTLNHVAQTAALKAEYPDSTVPYCPETTMRQQYEEEFKKDMGDIANSIEALVQAAASLADKPSVTKADRKAFVDIAKRIRDSLANSLPFVQGQFNESLDRVLTEAKADLESFTDQLAHSIGSAAIAAQIKGAKPDLQLPLGGGEDYTTPQL